MILLLIYFLFEFIGFAVFLEIWKRLKKVLILNLLKIFLVFYYLKIFKF